jgi:hypothetical protein
MKKTINQVVTSINGIVAEYESFNRPGNEVVGAMAYTIGQQRERIKTLEQKIQELQNAK